MVIITKELQRQLIEIANMYYKIEEIEDYLERSAFNITGEQNYTMDLLNGFKNVDEVLSALDIKVL
jgi:hypothetical protein